MAAQTSRYTLRGLLARVQGDLGLRGQALITKDDVLQWGIEASDDLAQEFLWYRTEATAGTTDGTRYYSFPSDLLAVESIYHDGIPLRLVTSRELTIYNYDWRNASEGTPLWWYRRGYNDYALHPIPDTTDTDIVTIYYAGLPPVPDEDDDTFTIPRAHDGAIVKYCLYKAALKDSSGEGRDRIAVYRGEWEQAKAKFGQGLNSSAEGELLVLGSDNLPGGVDTFDPFWNAVVT